MRLAIAGFCAVLAAASALSGTAVAGPEGASVGPEAGKSLLDIPGQWDDPTEQGGGKKQGDIMKSLEYGAVLLLETSGRGIKCTHARGPGGPAVAPGCPYQHSQVNQDADSYLSWECVALAGRASFKGVENLTVTGELKIGVSWSTLNYEVGAGSNWWAANWPDNTMSLDSNVGFPHLGLRLDAAYKLFDAFSAGGGWSFCYGTGNIDPSTFFWTFTAKGFYSFTEQTFHIRAQYDTEYATPFLGFALCFHNGWAELKDKAQGSGTYGWKWLLDYRETSQFSVILGAEKKFEAGHYIRLEFSLIGTWAARLAVGFML